MISTIASALIPATTISTTIDSSWNSTTTIITTALNTSQYLFYTPSAASSIGAQNITTRHSGTSSMGSGESGVIDLQTLDDIFNFNLNNGTSIPPGASITGGGTFNNSTVNSGYYPVFPTYIRNTSMVFCVIIMCLGVIGNVMVPIVILKTKDMRNSTNIFLVNLSVADLLVLLVCTPTVLVEVNSRPETWVLGEEMCKAVPFVELTVAHASVLTILAISFERYYAICEPLKAGYVCTKTRASLICLLAWFFAAVFTSPILCIADYRYVEYFDGSTVPACQTLANSFWPAFYFLMTIFVFFIIPLIILLVLYLIIAKTLIHDAKHIVCNKHPDQYSIRGRKQVVLMLGTVIFIFFVCLIPFRVFTLWIIISPDETVFKLGVEKYYNILYFCRVMVYLNSAINPILYNLMSSKFRHGFMLVCLRQKNSIHFRSRDRSGTLRTSVTSYRHSMIRQNSSLKINNFRMNSLDSSPKFNNRSDHTELRSRLCSTNENYSPLFYRNGGGRNNSTETQISFRNLRLIDEEQQFLSDEPLTSASKSLPTSTDEQEEDIEFHLTASSNASSHDTNKSNNYMMVNGHESRCFNDETFL
ncbi:growth hormone secretagogue receptor type 1 [Chrysoperla carnea]|uniref:growth hormone secretagogue receptor type 1 n=1 Tax=Chrysoperla carnea TaxID=189513 RepID=UPI001D07E672|nr:growth hormone secretagogue receptor type 1 [Chrysoperla carnea]